MYCVVKVSTIELFFPPLEVEKEQAMPERSMPAARHARALSALLQWTEALPAKSMHRSFFLLLLARPSMLPDSNHTHTHNPSTSRSPVVLDVIFRLGRPIAAALWVVGLVLKTRVLSPYLCRVQLVVSCQRLSMPHARETLSGAALRV